MDILVSGMTSLPAFGKDTLVSRPIQILAGGSAANVATHGVALARTGLVPDFNVMLHSRTGRDFLGEFMRSHLNSAGVTLKEGPAAAEGPGKSWTQGATVVMSGQADRGFLTHRGCTAEFTCDDIDCDDIYSHGNHLHVAGYYNVPGLWPGLPHVLRTARKSGLTTSLNPQFDARQLWTGLDECYEHIGILIVNELEAEGLSGKPVSTVSAAVEVSKMFMDRGVGLSVITLGSEGAVAAWRSGSAVQWMHQPTTETKVVDTTGAGDAFSAGFLASWMQKSDDIGRALQVGCAMGTAAITKEGGSCTSSMEEIQSYLLLGRLQEGRTP